MAAGKNYNPWAQLSAHSDDGALHVVIETPKGSHNKFDFAPEHGLFKLGGVLPAGAVFPYDFGFVPGTLGEDGDPLDVLLLMDEPAFTGCLVPARLIGVIEANQTERDGETMRNDRLIAVAQKSYSHGDVTSLDDLNDNMLHEVEHFFASYNEVRDKHFEPLKRAGPQEAARLVTQGEQRLAKQKKRVQPASKAKPKSKKPSPTKKSR
jgi:inorganic pyrophosphatase